MEWLILLILLAVLATLGFLVARVIKDAPDRVEWARLQTREQDFQEASRQLREKTLVVETLQAEKARLAADLENEKRVAAEKIKLLQDAETRLKTEFENLANRIFEDKGRIVTEQNRARIADLLQPFKEQLEMFRKRVDEVHKNDTEQSARLLEQVRHLQEVSNKVSDDANNLAKAIKGDVKQQGGWGELIVERIFESSGLERGREYDRQVTLSTEDGSKLRPDFIVYLPGGKAVIVDSKVSLTAYERFCGAQDDAARKNALDGHVASVRKHIDELKTKQYGQLLGNRTLDFVLMCIPIEPAYQTAMQADENLVCDLARTNVVVTGPATLMITLKLIAQIWRRENENRNAVVIADKAGRLYDQVVLITEAAGDARKKLGGAVEAMDLMLNRIQDGRGNLINRIEELRKLGAKVNKQLPAPMVEQSSEDDTTLDRETSPEGGGMAATGSES